MAEFGDDPGKIMLKIDFSNAFNMVDRTEMLAQVFPPWGLNTVILVLLTCFLGTVCFRVRQACSKVIHSALCFSLSCCTLSPSRLRLSSLI